MTTIEATRYKDAYEITADGHATGSVEVCAAISVLMQAAALWTWKKGGRDDQVLEEGHARVLIPRDIPGARVVFEFLSGAFEKLSEDDENFCIFLPNVGHENKYRLIQW